MNNLWVAGALRYNLTSKINAVVGIITMGAYFCNHLSENYVDLSDIYVDLSDHYVDLSDVMSTCQIYM